MNEIGEFIIFLKDYLLSRLISAGQIFEGIKDIIVAFLIVKRGKYSSSFLNTSFLMIVAAAVVGGPIIAENTPFLQSLNNQNNNDQALVVSYNPYGGSLGTVYSVKPEIISYQVVGGDSLASIAKKFNISVNSIKWSNNLKSDLIKPGQVLEIPPFDGVVHKVETGETVYSIAKKYKVTAQNIVNFPLNDFVDIDTFSLSSGQTLFVPGGVIENKPVIQTQFIATIQAGVRGSSNFIWPTSGSITQYPVAYHMALDIANPSQPPVLAADSGTVIYAGCLNWGYGCHVIIDHGNGYQSLYAHLSSYSPNAGDSVSQGSQIGNMGSTGRSTGTHLHFEVRSGGQVLNPLNFLK
ncbi:MAG: Peptidase M23 family protein [Candidatus Roizmanbacteria bacterium GW2011_GWA2_33_33]|uniref:Peptidase M23 family protein n=1 Tax=Candidatus Roizmanbacteria bacterium GW2011_GWA2_33_33 TaxID=1618476 RepID=A0A0G0A3M0_9BACT|nr:MAG: Peptidase M23 family protein [Candidatus Roizmanbacteria bacterium GW2011_GWA2_33_33]